ncbi:protein-disulfide reductase DsbD family protein [Shewanella sp. 1_MG-2023]|uniref:protein-disulfide reductase DsbD family protein n=1 Tax=unclassified Shewanella TaxID=196818 RepID=UPI0026E1ABF4|nr:MULTISPECIES: protein-disulfide reductase DsbD domain-containing protein [unclassified Shewanella]MDO6612439.1 protein-disulfide reductase DsbD family protein [Shewanella sp. 7_MG-2023]MDO6772520.1 protein-disulfide reductase DsbD family protein [Shewanella sp. 2_MG-2023]MDO6794482.1 protein-disulfide reductase DsbD family protein [Shewanella sp. 1_MG-2023]
MLLLMSAVVSSSTIAATTGWLVNDNHPPVKVRFMLTGELDAATKTVPAILDVQLDDDWKMYWRTPGEGGIAPKIDWGESTNFGAVNWQWPTPQQYTIMGYKTQGYQGEAVFPIHITVDDINANTALRGKFTLSSCTTVCVLTDYQLKLDFTANELQADTEAMFAFNKAISTVPQLVDAEASAQNVQIGWDTAQSLLQVTVLDSQWRKPQVIVDGDKETNFNPIGVTRHSQPDGSDAWVAQFEVSNWSGDPKLLEKQLNVTVSDNQRAYEYTTSVQLTSIEAAGSSLLTMMLFALIGGLILNVMPCVLPVLGMKLSSVIAAPDLQKTQIRQQFIASALGILVSFWLLAAFVIMLKFTGQAVGWGVQFQNPWFIGFMTIVTSVFALNMLGAFEINLPSSLQTKLATTGGNDHRGHFLQGMFATLLATPCSAPFLGTAVAFALGADVLSLIVIFTALAIGMALPWILVAAFPQVARYFPKPGRWMNIVKVFFSVLLLITSLWLISLLSSFITVAALWVIAAVLVLTFFGLMAKQYGLPAVIASFSMVIIFAAISAFATSDDWSNPLPTDLVWTPLEQTEITATVAQGKTVFVDVTADWCITCKANKVGVILQDPVYSTLKQDNIMLVEGDWTTASQPITDYLQSHGRFGVPFNVVYGPNAPDGIKLPVILTTEQVLAAIERASGN